MVWFGRVRRRIVKIVAFEVVEVQSGARQRFSFPKGLRLGQGLDALGVFRMLEQFATEFVRAVQGAEVGEVGCLVVVRHGRDDLSTSFERRGAL
jgi:hypothetical protein